jgi:hypothetical protein
MKVTSSKTIHLSEKELKTIIADWLLERSSPNDSYYQKKKKNHSTFEFSKDGNLVIIIDGEIVEFDSEKK